MSSFKSPELILDGKVIAVKDTLREELASFYVKGKFLHGEDWKLVAGKEKFESFEAESVGEITPIQQPFALEYVSNAVRGWPRLLVEIWRVDEYGRHNIYGYGTAAVPMASGWHRVQIPCWRPTPSWFDRAIGANSQLQYPDIVGSSLSKYGLRGCSGCLLELEMNIIGRNFHLHGVER